MIRNITHKEKVIIPIQFSLQYYSFADMLDWSVRSYNLFITNNLSLLPFIGILEMFLIVFALLNQYWRQNNSKIFSIMLFGNANIT